LGQRRGLRGELTCPEDRQKAIDLIYEAVSAGARKGLACQEIGKSHRTIQRWQQEEDLTDKRSHRTFTPRNKLTEKEEAEVLKVINSSEFCDLSPDQIVPKLADKGIYIASESTIYRILRRH